MVDEQHDHDLVVHWVARNRYPFPDQTDWPASYETIVNIPRKRGIEMPDGRIYYPDIVIVDRDTDSIVEVGEVETMVEGYHLEPWAAGANASKVHPVSGRRHFFVYVPVDHEGDAQQLLNQGEVDFGGVRTWEIIDGEVVITPITTPVDAKDHR